MKKFENMDDVAKALEDGCLFNPDVNFNYETIGEVVDALVDFGKTDKVYVRHDDHLGLKSKLSEAFLKAPLNDIDKPEFESDIEAVLEQANIIIPLSERELSESDIEEIRDYKISMGEVLDD